MLNLSRPIWVIHLLFIPAIQSHVVSLWSHFLDVQSDQYMMSNVPSFFITSCNAGQVIVTFWRIVVGEEGLPSLSATKEIYCLSAVFLRRPKCIKVGFMASGVAFLHNYLSLFVL